MNEIATRLRTAVVYQKLLETHVANFASFHTLCKPHYLYKSQWCNFLVEVQSFAFTTFQNTQFHVSNAWYCGDMQRANDYSCKGLSNLRKESTRHAHETSIILARICAWMAAPCRTARCPASRDQRRTVANHHTPVRSPPGAQCVHAKSYILLHNVRVTMLRAYSSRVRNGTWFVAEIFFGLRRAAVWQTRLVRFLRNA